MFSSCIKQRLSVFLVGFLIMSLAGCNPTAHGTPSTTTLVPNQAQSTTGNPRPDWFKTPYSRLIDAIILDEVNQRENAISITYWEMQDNGFVTARSLESTLQPGGEQPQVVRGSPAERQKLMAEWRAKGFDARLIRVDGTSQVVSNFFIQYDPPAGYIWNAPTILAKTSLDLTADGKIRTISFGEAKTLSFKGFILTVQFRDGSTQTGSFTPPGFNGNFYRPNFYGVQYTEDGRVRSVEIPIAQLQQAEILITAGARVK